MMKKTIVFAAACMLAFTAKAQNGFYLSPSLSAGISNQASSYISTNENGVPYERKPAAILNYSFRAGIGYRYKHWRLESGLTYVSSGYNQKGLIFGDDFDPVKGLITSNGYYKMRTNYIGIPLSVGYAIPLSIRLSLVPAAGITATYLVSGSSELNDGKNVYRGPLTSTTLDHFGRVSIWTQASLTMEYKVSDKIRLFGGPGIQYLHGSTAKGKGLYNVNFNLGVSIGL